MFVFTIGVGVAAPVALTQAISVNSSVIGSASGVYGFVQMAVGAVCTAVAGLGRDPALSAALVLAAAGIVAQLSFWIALRWPGVDNAKTARSPDCKGPRGSLAEA
jgi:DHA1 family bicyclomycin/chloramphenicol resistance-like MFS transporter